MNLYYAIRGVVECPSSDHIVPVILVSGHIVPVIVVAGDSSAV